MLDTIYLIKSKETASLKKEKGFTLFVLELCYPQHTVYRWGYTVPITNLKKSFSSVLSFLGSFCVLFSNINEILHISLKYSRDNKDWRKFKNYFFIFFCPYFMKLMS